MLKSRKQLIAFILVVVAISLAYPAYAQYTPLVRLPGLPGTGSISLSMYLVGLYNFMVSIVGIVAVMMMIVGGMRYITAGGSSSAISDAKDIVSSAVYGLIIAIFAWVIVAAINPDVLYIKKPGLSSVMSVNSDCINSAAGSYIAPNTCICADGTDISAPGAYPARSNCNNACKAGSHCSGMKNNCVRDGVDSTTSPKFNTYPNNGKCMCADGADIVPGAFTTCQAACAPNNCFVADFRLGRMNIDGNSLPTDGERAKKYATNIADTQDTAQDYTFSMGNPYSCFLAINAKDYVSNFANVNRMVLTRGGEPGPTRFNTNCANASNLDLLAEPVPGYFGPVVIPMACPIGGVNSVYTDWELDPNCRKIKNPEGVVCPIKLCVEWNAGAIKREKVMYLKMYNVY